MSGLGRVVLAEELASRIVPSRTIPVPDTVSSAMQKAISQAIVPPGKYPAMPQNAAEWDTLNTGLDKYFQKLLPEWRERFGVTVVSQVIAGVHCYLITPKNIKEENRDRLLVGFHGGGFVGGAGDSGTGEAIQTAGLTGFKVLAVDYRLAPKYPFPAAMDDAIAVWAEIAQLQNPSNIGIFGSSAGGGMALSLVQRAKKEGLPMPAAVMVGTPLSDMSKTGDSYFTNAGVDNTIASYELSVEATAKSYAKGMDLKDPLLSPVYGDFTDFPPTFLVTGTRDLFLSNTVRVHRKLRQAGIEAQLEVYEGQSHDQFLLAPGPMHAPDAPEVMELYADVTKFFGTHLGR